MVDIGKIKERITCVQYCSQNGIAGINREGDRCVSPLRPDAKNPTSFEVWNSSWKDWGGDTWGDVIDLCALHKFSGDKGEAIRYLSRITGVENDGSAIKWTEYTQQLCAQIAYYHEHLPQEYRDYMHKRGITDDTIDRLRIGMVTEGNLRGRLIIPYYKNGYVSYFITRSMPGCEHEDVKYMKMKVDEYNDHCPWGLHTLDRDKDRNVAIIAEGAFDIMSFEQESENGKNWACLSAITGNFSGSQLKTILPLLRSYKQVYIIYDNDGAGRTAPGGAGEKFTLKMSKILFNENIQFRVCHCPIGYKDVSDYYADGGDLQQLLDDSIDGVLALAMTFGPGQTRELAAICRSGCRYRTKSEVAELFARLEKLDIWPKEFLQALRSECCQAPSEGYIADEVLRRHTLLHHDKLGTKEYDGCRWVELTESQLHNYIDKELGLYSTGARVSSISKLVRARCVTTLLFDAAPVVNFSNGTLELEPEIRFRGHSKDDMCTYCCPYPYEPGVRCKLWEDFIETVTDGDERKMSLLQEAAGYVLQPTNAMQAAVFLIGDGSNGKSVYTDTLKSVFTLERTSAVPIEQIDQSFQLVQMSTSILNICGEAGDEISEAATKIFKAVVGGDIVQACRKGKDFFPFQSRTKFFINCNGFPKTTDTSDGFTRRCAFIRFPLKFVIGELPKRANERVGDKDLVKKLQTQESLTGIFNWVLEGYKVISATGYFTKTEEADEIKEQYKETINPLVVFIKDRIPAPSGDDFSVDELYSEYVTWTEVAHNRIMTRSNFRLKIQKVIEEYYPTYERYRSSKCRLNWRAPK